MGRLMHADKLTHHTVTDMRSSFFFTGLHPNACNEFKNCADLRSLCLEGFETESEFY